LNGASVLISHGASLVQLYDPMFLPCALSFNSIRLLISASNSFAASASTDLSNAQTRTFNFAIFSRSNSNSTHADFNKIVTYASIAYTMQITTSGTGASIKRATVGWQTDSTGGSTTNTFSTSSAAMQMAGFNSRMILNIPWATTLSAGQWFIGAHTNAPIGAGQDAFIIGNYQCSWIGNSTIRSGLGDTGIGNANNNNAYLVGFGGHSNNSATSMITSFSLPTDVVFVQPDFMHRRWYAFV
jgi:hypothetical protein